VANNTNSLFGEDNDKTAVRHGYLIVIGAFLGMMGSGIVMSSFGVFFKPVSAEFGWSRAETSGAFSLSLIFCGIVGVIAGRLADKYSPRIVIISLCLLPAIGYFLLSQIHSLWQLYLYYGILVGAGLATNIPVPSLMARWYVRRRGMVTGICISGTAFGAAITPPIATQILQRFGWNFSYFILGCVSILLAIIAGLLLRDPPPIKPVSPGDKLAESAGNSKIQGHSFVRVVSSLTFWIICAIFFCIVLSLQTINAHIIPAATDVGVTAASAATIVTVTNAAFLPGSFVFGNINDKVGSKLSLIIATGITLISLSMLLFTRQIGVFYIFAIIYGVGMGGIATMRSTIVAEAFDMRLHGVILGVTSFIYSFGGAIGPLVAGLVFDISGEYQKVFIMIAIIDAIGLALAIIFKIRKTEIKSTGMVSKT
jgi:MFS family permease